jgi:nucleoside-diphosphate-sugar epimerase
VDFVGLALVPHIGGTALAGNAEYDAIATDPNNYDGTTNVVSLCRGRWL